MVYFAFKVDVLDNKKIDTNVGHSLWDTRLLGKLGMFNVSDNLRLIFFLNLLQKYVRLWFCREFDGASFRKTTNSKDQKEKKL